MSLDAFSTIIRPVVSEKSTANKIQIKRAVEEAFANKKVQVSAVNILHVTGKQRRRGRSVGMTRSWKKAVVTLRPGQRLDLFEGV
jgi:large subunit ribosomal protein L23